MAVGSRIEGQESSLRKGSSWEAVMEVKGELLGAGTGVAEETETEGPALGWRERPRA